ncbi:MAG: LppX_LprAFG lipoprotein [Nocardioides sp.]|nr:LppX_LprAFG lipoprotein [Nocardioides sp.]
MTRITRPALVSLAVGLVLAATGCSGNDEAGGAGGADQTPKQVVDAALATLDETSGLSITLATQNLPSGVTGVSAAEGVATHPPAFEGTFDLQVSGFPAQAEVVAVNGTTYARNSLLLPDWTPIDPADYGAPDPTRLMTPGDGFSLLVSSTTALAEGDSQRGGPDNEEILTSYTGSVPAQAVQGILPTATGDFDVRLLITEGGELRQVDATGVFYDGADALTYTIGFDDYGSSPNITAP